MAFADDLAAAVKPVIDAHTQADADAAQTAAQALETAVRARDTALLDAAAQKQRADSLQQQLDDCKAGQPPPPPPPKAVALVGAAIQGNGDPSPLERAAGVTLGSHDTYWNLSDVDQAVAQAKADHAAGRLPWLSFKVGRWAAAAGGAVDTQVRDLSAKLKALNRPVWVTWHAEPQGDAEGTAAEFVAMQDHLNPLLPANVVPYIVLIAFNTFGSNNVAYALDKWWPKTARGLGMNFYNPFGTVDPDTKKVSSQWRELSLYADKIAQAAKDRGVDWAIRETGLTDEAAADPRGAGWMARSYHAVSQNAVKVGAGWNYFNSSLNSRGSWPLGPASSLKSREFMAVMQEAHRAAA